MFGNRHLQEPLGGHYMKRWSRQSMNLVRYILMPEPSLNDIHHPKAPRHTFSSGKHWRENFKVWIWLIISILVSLAVGRLN